VRVKTKLHKINDLRAQLKTLLKSLAPVEKAWSIWPIIAALAA
jgi:hypothetical protein